MAIFTCRGLSLSVGETKLFDDASFNIEAGDRLCVTGRNGSGKTTLLRILMGELEVEEGNFWRRDDISIAALAQVLPPKSDRTVFEVVADGLKQEGALLSEYHQLLHTDSPDAGKLARLQEKIDHADAWNLEYRIESALNRLHLDGDTTMASLSGGWLRRVAIAQSLVTEPDLWILDEPTNHLDVIAIEWLESVLLDYPGTLVFVSHDRALMQRVATAVLDLDRSKVQRWDCGYDAYLQRKADQLELESKEAARLDTRLKEEEIWIRQGIKARRTRNEGRVRALERLREEKRQQRQTQADVRLQIDDRARSGNLVKELIDVSKAYAGQQVVSHLDLIIQRGDRLGIVGPNGCGKSTLLKLLLEKETPDEGQIRTGSKLQVAYFDQVRATLDPNKTVAESIAEGREFVSINNQDIHVVSYLRNFLFTPDHARSPVRILSGGEQNRLLLARLFSMPANLLVLDEPTNDLDIQSLELLEELLLEYQGTVLLVTHDRSFLDNVVTSMLVFEGQGKVTEYLGGYTDWRAAGGDFALSGGEAATADAAEADIKPDYETRKALQRAEQKRLKDLDRITQQIEKAEVAIGKLHELIAAPEFYTRAQSEQDKKLAELKQAEQELELLFEQWEMLEADS